MNYAAGVKTIDEIELLITFAEILLTDQYNQEASADFQELASL